jgi:hypothetical protein
MLHGLVAFLSGCLLSLIGVSPLTSPAGREGSNDIVIRVSKLTPECKCLLTVGNAVATLTTTCCTPNPPFIQVTVPDSSPGVCKVDGEVCRDDNKTCKAVVKAEIQFPAGTCQATGGVTGPGIGTINTPCQAAAPPNNVSAQWTLLPKCRPGSDGDEATGVGTLKFWCAGCATGGQEPAGAPDLQYKPKAICAPCQ